MPRRLPVLALLVASLIAVAAQAATAQAADRITTYTGFAAPGTPAKYNKVRVLKQGPANAKHVLVLAPGTSAGGAYFRPIGADIVARLRDWQVWSVERRENLLEDHSRLDQRLGGTLSSQGIFDYYLGWIGNNAITTHFAPVADSAVPFAKKWGMQVAVEDLRVVVKKAEAGHHTVALGGHSLGGSIATAYATWDFGPRRGIGAANLKGLVLIDGGSGGGTPPTAAEATTSLATLNDAKTSPFLDLVGLNLPWAAGVFAALGSTEAIKAPKERAIVQSWPLFPAMLNPSYPASNAAIWGNAVDTQTGPKSLALVQMHLGHVAASGDPRQWVDGELVPLKRSASLFSGIRGMDGASWYHPKRLSLDSQAVNGGIKNPAQTVLGVRATHGQELDLPIYAFETSLGKGRVLKAARTLAKQSGIGPSDLKLVSRSATYAHIDPLAATPSKNDFLKTLLPFLKRTIKRNALGIIYD